MNKYFSDYVKKLLKYLLHFSTFPLVWLTLLFVLAFVCPEFPDRTILISSVSFGLMIWINLSILRKKEMLPFIVTALLNSVFIVTLAFDQSDIRHLLFVIWFILVITTYLFFIARYSDRVFDYLSSTSRIAFFLYAGFSLGGALLLELPVCQNTDHAVSFIDALFTSVSALCVTGLATVNIADEFNFWGQLIITVLIQIGGIGIVVFATTILTVARRRMSLYFTKVGTEFFDIPDFGNLADYLIKVLKYALVIECVGMSLFFTGIHQRGNPLWPDVWSAIFHAISAFNNAGFSIYSENLWNIDARYGALIVVCLLVISGGLGFPVLFEVVDYIKHRKTFFSPHTKMVVMVSGLLIVLGCGFITITEYGSGITLKTVWNALFYSIISRTAGFNTIAVSGLTHASWVVLIFLMVIGGSPMSTAGGIKTSTAGILYVSAQNYLSGKPSIQFARRELHFKIVQKAITVFMLYSGFAFGASLIMIFMEPFQPIAILFEIVSALSTVGLSTGITPELSDFSKYVIMAIMLVGRVGLITFVYAGIGSIREQKYRYPSGHLYIG